MSVAVCSDFSNYFLGVLFKGLENSNQGLKSALRIFDFMDNSLGCW